MMTTAWTAPDPELLRRLAQAEEPRAGAGRIFGTRGAEGVTELVFVRHAQMPASQNSADDMPLTETGRQQAELLGAYMAQQLPLSAVYASPLQRTLATAQPIAAAQGLPLVIEQDLREIESHIPGGVSLADHLGEARFQAMQQAFRRERRWDSRGDLYETSDSIRGRVTAAVERAIVAHPGGRIALVTHGPVINAYLASIVQSPFDFLFQPRLTSLTIVLAREEMRGLVVLNATPHFGCL